MLGLRSHAILPGFLCLAIGMLAPAARAQTPRIMCAEIAPLCYASPQGNTGLAYEIGRELLRRMGRKTEIELVPFARMMLSIQNDSPVISLWVGRIPERENYTVWISPILRDDFCVYTLKGRNSPRNLEQVRQLRAIGTIISGANQYASEQFRLPNTQTHANDKINGRMLLYGRLDGWIATQAAVKHFIRENRLGKDEIVRGFKLANYVAYVGASRAVSKEEIARWKNALQGMIDDGSYLRILERYDLVSAAASRPQ